MAKESVGSSTLIRAIFSSRCHMAIACVTVQRSDRQRSFGAFRPVGEKRADHREIQRIPRRRIANSNEPAQKTLSPDRVLAIFLAHRSIFLRVFCTRPRASFENRRFPAPANWKIASAIAIEGLVTVMDPRSMAVPRPRSRRLAGD